MMLVIPCLLLYSATSRLTFRVFSEISPSIVKIAMKFGADIHGPQRMNPTLTFHLVPPAGLHAQ